MSYSYPGMRLGMLIFMVQCDKIRKVMDTRQIKMRKGESERERGREGEGVACNAPVVFCSPGWTRTGDPRINSPLL